MDRRRNDAKEQRDPAWGLAAVAAGIARIAQGTKLRPNIVAIGLNKLVRDGLVEDNDGHFRCTDKGFGAALA